ncbi:MAG: class I SAM-dependent methyltransferase [Chloroflexales bacterium]|nr:class I SAM-dependent methyltransferase [Chloroflexales bacterium]
MQIADLIYLRCPTCHAALRLHIGDGVNGSVRCANNTHTYIIRHGILDLLPRAHPTSMAAWSNEWRLTAWAYERIWRPYALSIFSGTSFGYDCEQAIVSESFTPTRGLIVDIACSNGLYARIVAKAYPQKSVIGIDRSMPMLIEAQRRAIAARLPISYIRADARTLPMRSGVAEGIVMGGSLNEMADIPRVFTEISRIATPTSTFVNMALIRATRFFGKTIQSALSHGGITFFQPDAIIAQLTRYGWQIKSSTITGIVWFINATRTGA